MVATKKWLLAQGLGLHFIDNAVRSGKLQLLAAGVYAREECNLGWEGVVASLQRMSECPVHVGGLTALEIAGLSHYLQRGSESHIQLCSDKPLPRWVNRIQVDVRLEWCGTRRLWPASVMADNRFVREQIWQDNLPPVICSGPEKAFLELLMEVPKTISFEHADQLMQGAHNLSPRKLNTLLEACINVKVKRLFLWLAERHQHSWFKYLTPESYDLGVGKRMVAKQGRLEPRWHITVPREM